MRWLAVGVGLILSSAAIAAEDKQSGNFFLPHCKSPNAAGVCVGRITALAMVGNNFPSNISVCPPEQATTKQLTTVIVRYLEKHPERLHESFNMLALVALHEAWPCK
jgi:hypothetical protein